MSHLSALKQPAAPSREAGFLAAARWALRQILALLARGRKWRRDRAALAGMDYAALCDIGFVSAPWSNDPGAADQFARSIAWRSDKQLRALLRDCSQSRDAAQQTIKQISVDGSRHGRRP